MVQSDPEFTEVTGETSVNLKSKKFYFAKRDVRRTLRSSHITELKCSDRQH